MNGQADRAGWFIMLAVCLLWTTAVRAGQAPTLERARALYDAGKLGEAGTMLGEMVRAGTGDAGVYLLLGVIQRTNRHLPEAIATLDRAHALDPQSAQISTELATTLAWHRDLDRAIGLYRAVLAKDQTNVGARIGLGFALAWQGHLDEARVMFQEMCDANPRLIDPWLGLGFVDRAALRRADAEAAYRRALDLDPQNKDAEAGLKELHWDRRLDLRLLAGAAGIPDAPVEHETRLSAVYAVGPRATVGGGYQRFAYGAPFPIAGGEPVPGTKTEQSVEGGANLRFLQRITIGPEAHVFFGNEATRGVVRVEGVFELTPRISLLGSGRIALSTVEPRSLPGGTAGVSVGLGQKTRIGTRAIFGSDTRYEPRLTLLGILETTPSRRLDAQLLVFHSDSDPRFAFTSVAGTMRWLLTPSFGLSASASRRTQTFERTEAMVGLVIRR